MLSVDDFRKKYPDSTDEQVALYAAAVAAEQARGPIAPEPDLSRRSEAEADLPMPRVTVPAPAAPAPMTRSAQRFVMPHLDEIPPPSPAPDLTTDIRRIVLGRNLSARERAAAERPDMTGDDLLALLAGVPNAREWEALEGD